MILARLFLLNFILFGFLITQYSCPSISTILRFRRQEDGKVVVMLVTDRMIAKSDTKRFRNFKQEWMRQYIEGDITEEVLHDRIENLLDYKRRLTLKPSEYERPNARGTPPKLQLAGRGRKQIGITFTGPGYTLVDFARKLKRKRQNRIRNLFQYNTMRSVANGLEKSHRKMVRELFAGVEQPEEVYYTAKGGNIHSITVGRNKFDEVLGYDLPKRPKVKKLEGNLYSSGWNREAMRYLKNYFGPPNKVEWADGEKPPELQTYPMDDVKQHVIHAMRLNAWHSADRGVFAVTENFDSYIFSPNEKPIYWEHEPEMEPRIKQRIEKKVSPQEITKRIMEDKNGAWIREDIPGRFYLTKEQKEWKKLAEKDFKKEWNQFNFDMNMLQSEEYKKYKKEKYKKLKRSNSITFTDLPAGNRRATHHQARRNSFGHAHIPDFEPSKSAYKYTFAHSDRRKTRMRRERTGLKMPSKSPPRARGG